MYFWAYLVAGGVFFLLIFSFLLISNHWEGKRAEQRENETLAKKFSASRSIERG